MQSALAEIGQTHSVVVWKNLDVLILSVIDRTRSFPERT